MAWLHGGDGATPLDTLEAIRTAHRLGFDTVDVTSYYIPGFDGHVPMGDPVDTGRPRDAIVRYARDIRALCQVLGVRVSGTGVRNDFARPDPGNRAFDVATLDLDELFVRIRSSAYRSPLPFEMIWEDDDPDHPSKRDVVPWDQVEGFLTQVRAAAERTKEAR